MQVSDKNRGLARYLRDAMGGTPSVRAYYDDTRTQRVDVFWTDDRPDLGITSFSTLGFSDHSIGKVVDGLELRVELVAAFGTQFTYGANVVASACFSLLKNGKVSPGEVATDIIQDYYPSSDLKHAMLVSPLSWELQTQKLLECAVAWLQLVPISQAEFDYLQECGAEKLEDLFVQEQIDVYDLERVSVLKD